MEIERNGLREAGEPTVWPPCLDFQCLQVQVRSAIEHATIKELIKVSLGQTVN